MGSVVCVRVTVAGWVKEVAGYPLPEGDVDWSRHEVHRRATAQGVWPTSANVTAQTLSCCRLCAFGVFEWLYTKPNELCRSQYSCYTQTCCVVKIIANHETIVSI